MIGLPHSNPELRDRHPEYVLVRTGEYHDWYADPARTCLLQMRDGLCTLDLNHRGRHSTVTFYCDGCGQARRGQPYGMIRDANGDVDVVFCFMCVRLDR